MVLPLDLFHCSQAIAIFHLFQLFLAGSLEKIPPDKNRPIRSSSHKVARLGLKPNHVRCHICLHQYENTDLLMGCTSSKGFASLMPREFPILTSFARTMATPDKRDHFVATTGAAGLCLSSG